MKPRIGILEVFIHYSSPLFNYMKSFTSFFLAGSFGTVHRAEWHGSVSCLLRYVHSVLCCFQQVNCLLVPMQDVAVKVLSVQDFHDDQLREFLREVCAG